MCQVKKLNLTLCHVSRTVRLRLTLLVILKKIPVAQSVKFRVCVSRRDYCADDAGLRVYFLTFNAFSTDELPTPFILFSGRNFHSYGVDSTP